MSMSIKQAVTVEQKDMAWYGPIRETLPLYRHKDLYANSDDYQQHKFFKDSDYRLEEHLRDLRNKGEDDYEFAHSPPYEREAGTRWRYRNRYSTLRRDTRFYKNMKTLVSLRRKCGTYSEYVLKAAVQGIEQSKADFALLYAWFAKSKFFNYDFWDKDFDFTTTPGYEEWCIFLEMCDDAFKNGHRGCCKYADFIERALA